MANPNPEVTEALLTLIIGVIMGIGFKWAWDRNL